MATDFWEGEDLKTKVLARAKAAAATLAVAGAIVTGTGMAAETPAAQSPKPNVTAPGPLRTEPAGTNAPGMAILRMAKQWKDPTKDPGGTIWRYFETWQTDVVRMDGGELVRVKPFVFQRPPPGNPYTKGPMELVTTQEIIGSAFPPEGWEKPDFDDGDWQRQPGPLATRYRMLASTCIRGKFEVVDPAMAPELSLEVSFHGGAVACVNGEVVGRAGLPAGKIERDTLADDYPKEANEPGSPQRVRTLSARVPEVHRAPAHPVMFTAKRYERTSDSGTLSDLAWSRCMIADVRLSAPAHTDTVVPNLARPKGLQVWNSSTLAALWPTLYGDPNEPLRPIRLFGFRNGSYSGQVVASSTGAIKGLHAVATELRTGKGDIIPASSVDIGYGQWGYPAFDTLESSVPAELSAEFVWDRFPPYRVSFQPIWVTVNIPRGAVAGDYSGKLTISAEGQPAVDVPIRVRVIGEWALPDPNDYGTFMGAIQSPDSVALKYKVPMWSEAHWKLLEKTFALMGQLGVKDVYIPLLAKTNLGNEQSMVRWIRQTDGTYKHDFSIVEKYVDMACRHLKPSVVVLWIHDRPFWRAVHEARVAGEKKLPTEDIEILPYTELDPATGETKQAMAPLWGTPEARAFWKPAIEGVQAILAKRGLANAMMFGAGTDGYLGPKCGEDVNAMVPEAKWLNRTHCGGVLRTIGKKVPYPVGYSNEGHSDCFELSPASKSKLGSALWKSKDPVLLTTSAWQLTERDRFSIFRIFAEPVLLSGWRGISDQGVDFWSGLCKSDRGTDLLWLYTWQFGVDPGYTQHCFLGAGKEGPAPTVRLRLMREALQEAEVRILVHDALTEEAQNVKLTPDLAKRCETLCGERMTVFRYCGWFWFFCKYNTGSNYDQYFDETGWLKTSEQFYEAAADVAKALK